MVPRKHALDDREIAHLFWQAGTLRPPRTGCSSRESDASVINVRPGLLGTVVILYRRLEHSLAATVAPGSPSTHTNTVDSSGPVLGADLSLTEGSIGDGKVAHAEWTVYHAAQVRGDRGSGYREAHYSHSASICCTSRCMRYCSTGCPRVVVIPGGVRIRRRRAGYGCWSGMVVVGCWIVKGDGVIVAEWLGLC